MAFKPGESGNPGGKAKKSNRAAGMAREHTEKAIQVYIASLASEDERIRLDAATKLLERGWGKAQEYVEVSGDEENPITTKITVELVRANTGS
jgi:hypothetical protein